MHLGRATDSNQQEAKHWWLQAEGRARQGRLGEAGSQGGSPEGVWTEAPAGGRRRQGSKPWRSHRPAALVFGPLTWYPEKLHLE